MQEFPELIRCLRVEGESGADLVTKEDQPVQIPA